MANYYELVSYVYDKNDKYNRYKEVVPVKIDGVSFKSVEDIDKYTASFADSDSLSSSLDEKFQNKKNFSIRITKNDGTSYYRSVIYNKPGLIDIINSLDKKPELTINGYRTIKKITLLNSTFADAWKEVEKRILKKDMGWLCNVFGKNDNYITLISRYVDGDYFDSETNSLMADLAKTFKDYEVFRKYLIYKDKPYKDKSLIDRLNFNGHVPSNSSLKRESPIYVSSVSTVFYDDDSNGYDPDDEAFLSPEEKEAAYGSGNESFDQYCRRQRGMKC